MANAQKYTMSAVGHMFNHYGRTVGENVRRNNEKIDPERTHQNYDIHTGFTAEDGHPKDYQMQALQQRLYEVEHLDLSKRKDINVMVDWVITLPEDVPTEKAKEFFQNCYDFCAERYGKENVISAWVHMDETTPHMHFSFVPVVKSEDGKERLCAKEVVSRFELTQFHPKLQEYVEEKMQQPVAILNGATEGGNLTIIEMKMRKELARLAELQATNGALEQTQKIVAEVQEMMLEVRTMYATLDKALKSKKFFGDSDKEKMKQVQNHLDELSDTVLRAGQTADIVKATLDGLNGKVNEHLSGIYASMKEMQAKAERRIKREKRKVEKQLRIAAEKEEKADAFIEKGVAEELQKLDDVVTAKKEEAAALDDEIRLKQQAVRQVNADLWQQQEFVGQGQVRQQQFTQKIMEWSMQNESGISQPIFQRR